MITNEVSPVPQLQHRNIFRVIPDPRTERNEGTQEKQIKMKKKEKVKVKTIVMK